MVAQAGHAVADELESDVMMRRAPLALGDPVAVRRDSQIRRAPNSSGLYDVLDLILDKGIVIDAFVRVSLVGIELVTVDLRVVIASVDTYLRYAEGVERLGTYNRGQEKKLPDMVGGAMKGQALKKGAQQLKDTFSGGDDDDQGEENEDDGQHKGLAGALTDGVRHILKKGVGGILHKVKGDDDDENEDADRGDEDGGDEESQQHGRGREMARQSRDRDSGRSKAGSRR